MNTVQIDKIIVNERKRAGGDVTELAESIKSIGLLNPITLNKDFTLIAGSHRLEAYKQLGFKEIPSLIIDVDNLTAELVEIDENLIRKSLTSFENFEQLNRRKEIYELLYPESKRENKVKSNLKQFTDSEIISSSVQKTFTQDTAEKTGKSQRSIQQSVQIANNIPDEVKEEIKGSKIENNKTDLLELSKQPAEKQKELVEKVKSGKAKSIKAAIKKENQLESMPEKNQEKETLISVEEHEKVKSALVKVQNELDTLKIENKELKTKILELESQLGKETEEGIKSDVIQDERIDYGNRKVLIDSEWLELPPAFEMQNKNYEQMCLIANNYKKTKQKES